MAPIKIMVNGMPGNMAVKVATFAMNDPRFTMVPASLTGPEITVTDHVVEDKSFRLIPPDNAEDEITKMVGSEGALIMVDYTHPSAVNANADLYCRLNLPFVMGTTGGDRESLVDTVEQSQISAVIAPNMGKQIVGFQAMIDYAARAFPGLFKGYSLKIKESHQKGKADTSGTAKMMVGYFNALGVPYAIDDIEKERDPEVQKSKWGIPDAYLTGHGWHTYCLTSPDQTVQLNFEHNINGRDIYIEGTLDAVAFLKERVDQNSRGTVFNMIDVLKAGSTS